MKKFERCPCSTTAAYHKCCKPYHEGTIAQNALLLMRSRYSAYALNLCDYIIETTHPEHPEYCDDRQQWKSDIERFCTQTRFDQLKIREFIDGKNTAFVTFTAFLRQADQDASFTEKSIFVFENGRWLYKSGNNSAESA